MEEQLLVELEQKRVEQEKEEIRKKVQYLSFFSHAHAVVFCFSVGVYTVLGKKKHLCIQKSGS